MNTEDPQYQDKRMVAQRNGKLSIQVFNVLIRNSYGIEVHSVILLIHSLILSSVQVYVGKEREAVLDMLPYLRLGYVSDPSEMQSVISSQGPICPVSLSHLVLFLDEFEEF